MILDGQVAVVTGGGRGIGKAIASRFAGEGADLAIVDVDGDTAKGTSEEIAATGRRAIFHMADVSDPEQVERMVAETISTLGRIDVVVNNAGIEKRQPFLEITRADWQRQIDVNLSEPST